jgi:glyoxylase-like metal-dependent hydrolase (beta-lactamase superfamily II)
MDPDGQGAYTERVKMVADEGGHTRREILRAAIGGAAGIALGAPVQRLAAGNGPFAPADQAASERTRAAEQTTPADAANIRLSDDLFVLRLPGQANVVAYTDAGGVVLVDGGSAAASDALMTAVAGLPGGGAVHTIFNTHWHPEQTGSNERLGKAGATIIAHENTRLWLTTDVTWPWNGQRFTRVPKIAQPNRTFYTTGRLEPPGPGRQGSPVESVRYGYIPDAAHTDGDMYVHFPRQNVLAVGDVVSGEGWPTVDWATGGWIGGIVGGLERLQTLADEDTRIVPARGPVLGLAQLKAQTEMYATLYDRLTQLLNKGRGPAEAVAAAPAKEFEERMGNADEFVRRAFESLWAYLSPDA